MRGKKPEIAELEFLIHSAHVGKALGVRDLAHMDEAAAAYNYIRVANLIASLLAAGKITALVLDWGCGCGQVSWLLQKRGATKQDSTGLRWALVRAAHRAALSPRFQDYYQRQRERHGAGKAAVALARKLAVIAHYRWWQALKATGPPKVEKVRERSCAAAWLEARPYGFD